MTSDNIYVTSPALPALDEFLPYLKRIWDNHRLTNMGELHNELEKRIAEYLGVGYVSLFCNGTIALQTGLQALRITGEVITTPYSFAATTHAIYWNHCKPVFCDIDADTFNIDASKIESLITPKTTCILPVHTYGNPCDIDEVQRISEIYGLKVIYDAAHTFGAKYRGKSLCDFGDLSMISFHATKVFNTIEGGALITNDPVLKKRIDYLKNFGFADEETVVGPGSNGKMNEVQAGFGLALLPHIDKILADRERVALRYLRNLGNVAGISLLNNIAGLERNWSYFPIVVDADVFGCSRDVVYQRLREENIFARKYFYPLISNFPAYRGLDSASRDRLQVANRISDSVLCLPIYPGLSEDDVDRICCVFHTQLRVTGNE